MIKSICTIVPILTDNLMEERRSIVAKNYESDCGDATLPKAAFEFFGLSVVWFNEQKSWLFSRVLLYKSTVYDEGIGRSNQE